MTPWSPDVIAGQLASLRLPDTLDTLHIRHSSLTTVPSVLATMPASVHVFVLEGAAITSIPDTFTGAGQRGAALAVQFAARRFSRGACDERLVSRTN
ncbi:Aste57867_8479 [Aphanomyces stellatus]|uniref:Aste57867_8479 protein n=1 Tax=Aphanomyces stellatus TaxID=120398 RepID=A0A485KKC3_9STRA|nr:hypothetical protein As57867_008447 [Aphanomyces stellatus]VFT85365.1 Aste57867_8479 [Aphanomyces stellatus]